MKRCTMFVPYRPKTLLDKGNRPDQRFWTRHSAYPDRGFQHGCEFCQCLPCVQVRVAQTPLNKYTSSRRFQK